MTHLPYPSSVHTRTIMLSNVWAEKFHSSCDCELLHVLEGHIDLAFQDSGPTFRGTRGDTLFVPLHTMHCDRFDSREDLKIFYVYFSWPAGGEILAAFRNDRLLAAPDTVRREVRFLFERMRDDAQENLSDPEIECARLYAILNLLYRRGSSESTGPVRKSSDVQRRQSSLVKNARVYMERNFKLPIRLDDVAGHLGISPYYLSRLFPGESGFTFYEYLTELRMEYACNLLCDGNHTIDEIAALSGYDNGNYFAKVFRRRMGMTPGSYRRTHRAEPSGP